MGYRENVLKILDGEKPIDFPPTEFMMFWPETVELYERSTKTKDLAKYFGLGEFCCVPCDFNPYPAFQEVVLEEDERFITKIDGQGITCKIEKGTSAMPHYIDFPIKDRKTYEIFAERLNPFEKGRICDLEPYKDHVGKRDCVRQLLSRGPFAFLRDFIRFDQLMMMFVDDPELILTMTMNHADFLIKLWGQILDRFTPDVVYLGEDMAYKNGSMISPAMVREFILPAWKKIIDFVKSKGVKRVILDSDGNIMNILPIVCEAGFTAVLPLERVAGMDPEIVRERFLELSLIGGVDKLQLAKGKKEIDRELDKIERLYAKGRYLPSCDHSVPPIISFENYNYYFTEMKRRLSNF